MAQESMYFEYQMYSRGGSLMMVGGDDDYSDEINENNLNGEFEEDTSNIPTDLLGGGSSIFDTPDKGDIDIQDAPDKEDAYNLLGGENSDVEFSSKDSDNINDLFGGKEDSSDDDINDLFGGKEDKLTDDDINDLFGGKEDKLTDDDINDLFGGKDDSSDNDDIDDLFGGKEDKIIDDDIDDLFGGKEDSSDDDEINTIDGDTLDSQNLKF